MRKSALYALGLVVAALVALGLVVLFSASEVKASKMVGHDSLFFLKRQVIYVCIGVVLAFFVAIFDYHKWRDYWGLTVGFTTFVFILLIVVFFFPEINGSKRWISFGPVSFQPAEFAKIATVIIVSVWLDKISFKVETFKYGTLWPACFIALMAGPVFFQPDFGSVMVIGLAGFMLMFVAGTPILFLLSFLASGAALFVYKVITNPNRMARLFAFAGKLAEGADGVANAASYQSDMSLVAINRGGIFGKGLLGSMQKQSYLPEVWTDFILAVGAEELGLAFSASVILLFVAFFCICVYIARNAADRLGQMLVIGMAFVIFFQAMFNVGVVCAALPTKGMALPFFSYGGTHILSSFFAIGIIFSVGIHTIRDSRRAYLRKVILK